MAPVKEPHQVNTDEKVDSPDQIPLLPRPQ
jgi:hypothetical protein